MDHAAWWSDLAYLVLRAVSRRVNYAVDAVVRAGSHSTAYHAFAQAQLQYRAELSLDSYEG